MIVNMKRIAVFASGSGTNAQNIIEYFSKNDLAMNTQNIKDYLDSNPSIYNLNANIIRNEGLQISLEKEGVDNGI